MRALLFAALLTAGAALPAAAAAALPVHSGDIDTPDGSLHYEIHGELVAGRAPLVLVAGGPGSSRTSLMPEFDALARDRAVVYFDNIGRGRSSDLPAGRRHSPERDADDIERLRAALGVERIALLGHSYGGYPALAYAARHPERLARLVISSSGHGRAAWQRNIDNVNHFIENQYPEVWARLQALRRAGRPSCDPEYQALYGEPIGQLYWRDPAKAAARPIASTDPRDGSRPAVYCAIVGADAEIVVGGTMANFDMRPRLAAVRVPTLITAGRYDPVCPPVVAYEIGAAFAPGVARVRVYEHSAHRPWVEEGPDYFKALREFLAES